MKTELLNSSVIRCDETTVQVLKDPGKTPTTESYMWAYRSGGHEEKQIVLFDYQPERSGDYARKFLEGQRGFFVTDGYAGYNKVAGGIRCAAGRMCAGSSSKQFLTAIRTVNRRGKAKRRKALNSAKTVHAGA